MPQEPITYPEAKRQRTKKVNFLEVFWSNIKYTINPVRSAQEIMFLPQDIPANKVLVKYLSISKSTMVVKLLP
jgi:hypothetical protein